MRRILRRIRKALPRPIDQALRTFWFRERITPPRSAPGRLAVAAKSLRDVLFTGKTILCYPQTPVEGHVLFKVALYLGYRVTSDPRKRRNLAIKWFNAWDGDPRLPAKDSVLQAVPPGSPPVPFLNLDCIDITKDRVARAFEDAFGYAVSVDPRHFQGTCVAKSNWNGLHEGRLLQCPIDDLEPNVTYQRIVDNEEEGGWVRDMRVLVLGDTIPFVYLKYRAKANRFVDRVHTNTKAETAEVADVLSLGEQQRILAFCRLMCLDYCELDVLRDRGDGKIYIVDVNNTPFGPPSPITEAEGNIAVTRLARAFEAGLHSRTLGRVLH